MVDPDKIEVRRNGIFGLAVCCLVFVSAATWLLMPHLPATTVCSFQNIWFLKSLWFQNLTMSDGIASLHYAPREQCIFVATRSMLSLYMAVFSGAVIFYSRNERATHKLKNGVSIAVISVCMIGYLTFLDGFDDQHHGFRAGFSYRTYDSVNLLLEKSVFRMIQFYTIVVVWGGVLVGFFQSPSRQES